MLVAVLNEDMPVALVAARAGSWSPLRHAVFRSFWAFSFLAFIGGSMQNVAAGWLMVELGGSPLQVSLIQGAMSLSVVLAALPAGVLADMRDRRGLMLAALAGMMAGTGAIGLLAWLGLLTPALLLALTFAFGLATAAMTPAIQSTLPDLVPGADLPGAVALNGMSSSAARPIGPGLAGALIGWLGAGITLLLNVLAFVGLWIVIHRWRDAGRSARVPAAVPRARDALMEGLRFARTDAPFRALLLRTMLCFIGASAVLGLLPALVGQRFNDGAAGAAHYLGGLLSCYGVGSVLGSLAVPPLTRRIARAPLVWAGTALCGASMLALVGTSHVVVMGFAMLGAGLSWAVALTCVNISAQLLLPRELLARGLSISLVALMIALALGSVIWGTVATVLSVERALSLAAVVSMAVPAWLAWRHDGTAV